ncbi:hypothetical protein [Massilia sp. CCM 8734]|uniref:hypothetical protein n=1 Tax=Massilia sp. CCM 8734 TaxID=2609283 RepID=UPI00141D7FD4|nr:hypothetical protein [Massilia sp. CCM 8734]NHZ96281.1 hypothetical protein [Massilia sp. CCM 8734]
MSISPRLQALSMPLAAAWLLLACGVTQAAAMPKTDYWAPVLASVAGTYDSECTQMYPDAPGAAGTRGPVVVSADGNVTGAGLAQASLADMGVLLSRFREPNGAVSLSVLANKDARTVSFMAPAEGTRIASFGVEPNATRCKIERPFEIARQSLYATYAGTLDAKMKLTCLFNTSKKETEVDYQLANGILKVADQVVDLNKATLERVKIEPNRNLSYNAHLADERRAVITMDAQGQLLRFRSIGKDVNATCKP